MICTYLIRHLTSGLFYIGSTDSFCRRQINHLSKLRRGEHYNKLLQYAYDLDKNLKWETIEFETRELAAEHEYKLIRDYSNDPNMVNVIGAPASLETKEKMKAAWTEDRKEDRRTEVEKYWTEDFYKNKSVSMTGTKASVETKEKMSAQRKGSVKSITWAAEMAKRISKAVIIDGIEYPSKASAAKQLGLAVKTLDHRIKSTNPKFVGYVLKV